MTRNPNASSSWIPSWASNNSSTATVNDSHNTESRPAPALVANPASGNSTSTTANVTATTPSSSIISTANGIAGKEAKLEKLHVPLAPPVSGSKVKRAISPAGSRTVRKKASTSSLATMTSGSWLNWGSRSAKDPQSSTSHTRARLDEREDEEIDDNGDETNENDVIDEDDYVPDDNGDVIDDHVSQDKKRSTSWNFWNNGSNTGEAIGAHNNNNNLKKEKEKEKERDKGEYHHMTNTIVNSIPTIPTRQELQQNVGTSGSGATSMEPVGDSVDTEQDPSPEVDDAVLYKPHDKTADFQQINTHKNENLKENVIVPDWNSCLPHQTYSSPGGIGSSIFGSSTTSNESSQKGDLHSWRSYLNTLSTRLGFSASDIVEAEGQANEIQPAKRELAEKEFSLLYERSYKLYGRSLAKLPAHKRSCLPNYNKYYTKHDTDEEYRFNQLTQIEEDAEDPNSISISNDPLGNLLINHGPKKRQQGSLKINPSDIVNQKSGPLHKISKILIIGVHGFFPTKMIRPLIGAPKGTSLKFANEAEKAVIRYCIENNLINETESKVSIQKIALEKEGKIFDRVDFFTEIVKKWQNELNEADFIFVASHSQGCVVSIILLARLIKMGILKDPIRKRIGILGMAGINNGPFYGADKSLFMKAYSTIEHESLFELFELTKFDSQQSLVYKESMQIIINVNVKICFIGSINDQLVPLYSAVASHVFHPNIYRACYIDHSSQTPLFVQKLVSLCCQLQNLGYFDNNVIKELSTSLAGPMRAGGHSKIYNDGKVYDLGIKFVLDTDDLVIPPTSAITSPSPTIVNAASSSNPTAIYESLGESGEVVNIPPTNQVYIKEYNIGKIGTNPFILPWCLRGLLFNIEKNWPNNNKLLTVDHGKDLGKSGYDEINELYLSFEDWKPESKMLKELKFRLNGLRASKL